MMEKFGALALITLLVAITAPFNVWLGAHLTVQYIEWFLPSFYDSVTLADAIGWVAFASLIIGAIKFNLTTKADEDKRGLSPLLQAVALSTGWVLNLGVLYLMGLYIHWVLY